MKPTTRPEDEMRLIVFIVLVAYICLYILSGFIQVEPTQYTLVKREVITESARIIRDGVEHPGKNHTGYGVVAWNEKYERLYIGLLGENYQQNLFKNKRNHLYCFTYSKSVYKTPSGVETYLLLENFSEGRCQNDGSH